MTKRTIELIICPLASMALVPLMSTILMCFLFRRAVIFNHIFFPADSYYFPTFFSPKGIEGKLYLFPQGILLVNY